jgi:hypothetical protein
VWCCSGERVRGETELWFVAATICTTGQEGILQISCFLSLFPLQSSGKKCLLWNWKKKMAGVTPVQEMCCNVTFVHQKAGTVGRTEGKGEQGNFWKELFADTNWIRFIFLAVFVAYSSKLCFSVTRIPAGDEIRLDQWPMDFNFKARWSNQNSATKQRRPLSYCSCPQQVQPLLK